MQQLGAAARGDLGERGGVQGPSRPSSSRASSCGSLMRLKAPSHGSLVVVLLTLLLLMLLKFKLQLPAALLVLLVLASARGPGVLSPGREEKVWVRARWRGGSLEATEESGAWGLPGTRGGLLLELDPMALWRAFSVYQLLADPEELLRPARMAAW